VSDRPDIAMRLGSREFLFGHCSLFSILVRCTSIG